MSAIAEDRRYLGMAAAIGDALCREAIWDGERCNWGGAAMEPLENEWRVVWRSFGPTIYDGTAGIAIFLARLHAATKDPKHAIHAVAAIRQALSAKTVPDPSATFSLYAGALGVAYAAELTGRLCGQPELARDAEPILEAVAAAQPAQAASDVIAGLAGAITGLLALSRRFLPGKRFRDMAMDIGEALITQKRTHSDGAWSWPAGVGDVQGKDLVGYSHGTAGIACALLELWKETGEARFREAAERAHLYERRWYHAGQRNWPDLRPDAGAQEGPGYPAYWCHGAAGIGFARLRGYALTGDRQLLAEAEIALETTARHTDAIMKPAAPSAFTHNFSLCHGLAGNGDLFLYATRHLPASAEDFRVRARAIGEFGIAHHGAHGPQAPGPWPCGIIGGGETPSLLLGTSGIGLFYLRLAQPATPTCLMIEPGGD